MSRQQLNNNPLHGLKQAGKAKTGLLLSILLVAGILTLAWFMLPQGYSTDTSLIGKGKPAIVLIYDSDNLVSDQLMASFNQVRDTYGNQIEFLLVDLNAPGGRQFANTNGVTTASALFFSPEGRQVAVAHGAHKKEMLEDAIRRKFNLP